MNEASAQLDKLCVHMQVPGGVQSGSSIVKSHVSPVCCRATKWIDAVALVSHATVFSKCSEHRGEFGKTVHGRCVSKAVAPYT